MKKPLSAAPPRLQRMMLQLQKYDLDVRHVSGKEVPISDLLSRQPMTDKFSIEGLDLHVHTVMQGLLITDRRLESLRSATKTDLQMQTLKQTIQDGWPDSRTKCHQTILEFWNHRDELSCCDNLIFRGQTIVIPRSVRHDIIESVHQSHLGVEKTVRRAKDALFWPGMTKEITDFVLKCGICQKYRHSNQKEPLIPHSIPQRPWQYVSTDIFTWDSKEYLVTVDAYSNYFEIDLLPDMKSSTVIRKLKAHFARHGIPDTLMSDNAGQYTSEQMTNFAREWNFTQIFSSPLNPQSNGLAENTVKTAKRLLQKAKDSNKDPYISILEYRNTPLKSGYTPSQLLMGRKTKSILPVTQQHLEPQTVNPKNVQSSKKVEKSKQKFYYDKSSKPLAPLKINEYVRMQIGNPPKLLGFTMTDPMKFKLRMVEYTVVTDDYLIKQRRPFQKSQISHPTFW
jgi:transposase InsO family protein